MFLTDPRGLRQHYQQLGDGPDVVLIHALTSNLSSWLLTGIAGALASEYRVTMYDWRGHGASDVTPDGYTSRQLAEDFAHLHQALELGPAVLVGHSYGGVIAMHAASRYPDRVAGVVLSDSYFPGLRHLEPALGQAGPWGDLREQLLAAGVDIGEEVAFTRLFRLVAELDPTQMAAVKEVMGPAATRWLEQLPRLAETTAGHDAFEDGGLDAQTLCSVRQPVVALYDEHSPFSATCQFLEERLPDCTVDVVPGAKHFAPVQNSEDFLRLTRKHLRKMVTPCGS